MPSLESSDLHHRAVLWTRLGEDVNGEPVLRYPQQVMTRWTWRRGQTTDKQGQTVATDADVAVCFPSELVGAIMWKGGLHEVPGTADPPTPTSDICVVLSEKVAYDVKGVAVRRELKLARWNDTLPTVRDEI